MLSEERQGVEGESEAKRRSYGPTCCSGWCNASLWPGSSKRHGTKQGSARLSRGSTRKGFGNGDRTTVWHLTRGWDCRPWSWSRRGIKWAPRHAPLRLCPWRVSWRGTSQRGPPLGWGSLKGAPRSSWKCSRGPWSCIGSFWVSH